MKLALDEIRMWRDDFGSWWLEVRSSGDRKALNTDTLGAEEDAVGRIRKFQICGQVDGDRQFFGEDLLRLYTALFRVRKIRGF